MLGLPHARTHACIAALPACPALFLHLVLPHFETAVGRLTVTSCRTPHVHIHMHYAQGVRVRLYLATDPRNTYLAYIRGLHNNG